MIRTLQQDRFGSGFSGQFLGWERNGDDEGISIFIPKQGGEGVPVAENCRKPGSYFNWKTKYAGMLPPEMKS